MLKKLHHIGIAVKDLETTLEVWSTFFGLPILKRTYIERESIDVAFISLGNVQIELMQPTDEKCTVARFLKKNGEGIQHIAITVDDVQKSSDILQEKNLWIERIKDNLKAISFIHPISCNGVAIELISGDHFE